MSSHNAKSLLIVAAVLLLCLMAVGAVEIVVPSVWGGGARELPPVGEPDLARAPAMVGGTLADRADPTTTSVKESGGAGIAGGGDAVVLEPGVSSWWSSLPRHRRGWWVATALVDPEALVDAASYVRCEDLNPRDVPLSESQFRRIAESADPMGEAVRRNWRDRADAMHREMLDGVESGKFSERRGDNLTGRQEQIYAAELRFFKKRLEDPEDVSRAERLAIVNALGRATGGFVHTTRDGRTFSASLDELPRTQQLDQAARKSKGEMTLWVIGTMVDFGVLEVDEALRLADRSWKKLSLH